MKYFIIIFLVILVLIYLSYLKIKKNFTNLLSNYFGTSSFKEALEISELTDSNIPKSLSGMESISIPLIKKDFPTLNINELKGIAEKNLINYFNMLEQKEIFDLTNVSDKVKAFILSQINDISDKDDIHFDSIKIHRTVVNKYENIDGVATIYFETALEYKYSKNDELSKKIQDRFKTEFIYIIDVDKVNGKVKAIGLNCPNCGAPIKNIGHKACDYCDAGIVDIVKRNWILNSITRY